MSRLAEKFTAIVLAGDRGPEDPVARATGVSCKALVPVAGRPMVLRVLDALRASSVIDSILVSGCSSRLLGHVPELDGLISSGEIRLLENEASPSLSVLAALKASHNDKPVLVTTADHALLTPRMVDHFFTHAAETGCDVVAGLARSEMVAASFPESRRTVTRLRDGGYCGCNLFALLTPRAGNAVAFWRRVEEQRKHPLKIARVLGFVAVLRYLLGLLTLEEGLARLSALMGAHAGVVWMPDAEAAVDVDKIEDWALVEELCARYRTTAEKKPTGLP
ncbi:MAG: MobA-like NTP transferase domain containing protein [Deltaproteobacteria bacterium]|nr:MobA-like NTP transferase domain containing protein [Deltaproteobacteria bacterium]